jgi:hypothetical protein
MIARGGQHLPTSSSSIGVLSGHTITTEERQTTRTNTIAQHKSICKSKGSCTDLKVARSQAPGSKNRYFTITGSFHTPPQIQCASRSRLQLATVHQFGQAYVDGKSRGRTGTTSSHRGSLSRVVHRIFQAFCIAGMGESIMWDIR